MTAQMLTTIARSLRACLPSLNQLFDKVLAIPGVSEVLKPTIRKRGMPSATKKTANLVRQPAHRAGQVRLSLTQMRGHRIPGERSNNGVGSGGLDNNGAKNGESGDHHSQPGAAGANNLRFAAE